MIHPFPRRTRASLLSDKTSCSAAEMVSSAALQSLFVLSILSVTVSATNPGFYRVKFLEYRNPRGLDEYNTNCDGKEFDTCEFYFKIRFQVGNKFLKNFTSRVYGNNALYANNCISFGSNLSNSEPNPFIMNVSTFQGGLQFHIVVMDMDPGDGTVEDDKIEVLSDNISVTQGKQLNVTAKRDGSANSFLTFRIERKYNSTEASSTSASPTKRSTKDNPTHGTTEQCSNGKEKLLIIALAVVLLIFVVCFISGCLIIVKTRRKKALRRSDVEVSQKEEEVHDGASDQVGAFTPHTGAEDNDLYFNDELNSTSDRSNQEEEDYEDVVDDASDHIYAEVTKKKKISRNHQMQAIDSGQPDVVTDLDHQ